MALNGDPGRLRLGEGWRDRGREGGRERVHERESFVSLVMSRAERGGEEGEEEEEALRRRRKR